MSAEQVGVYILLLCHEWDGGPIPDDDAELSILANGAPAVTVRTVLERCFRLGPDGWVNDRLEGVREQQGVKAETLSRAGTKGAKARWHKDLSGHSQAIARPLPGNASQSQSQSQNRTETALPKPSKSKKKASTERPADWQPNRTHLERARAGGFDVATEVEAFKAYHEAKGNRFVSWDAAFTTWLLNAAKFKREGNRPPPDSEAARHTAESEGWAIKKAQVEARTQGELKRLNIAAAIGKAG